MADFVVDIVVIGFTWLLIVLFSIPLCVMLIEAAVELGLILRLLITGENTEGKVIALDLAFNRPHPSLIHGKFMWRYALPPMKNMFWWRLKYTFVVDERRIENVQAGGFQTQKAREKLKTQDTVNLVYLPQHPEIARLTEKRFAFKLYFLSVAFPLAFSWWMFPYPLIVMASVFGVTFLFPQLLKHAPLRWFYYPYDQNKSKR